jgi:nucleoid-associated protein YgaU
MADLDALKTKYAPVIDAINDFSDVGATLGDVSLAGDKLQLKATVPSKVVANRIWDIIKEVDSSYSDLDHQMTTSGGDEQPYTIANGDNLSKIAARFYGHANKYPEIAKANDIDNPDLIRVGQEIKLPVLS